MKNRANYKPPAQTHNNIIYYHHAVQVLSILSQMRQFHEIITIKS